MNPFTLITLYASNPIFASSSQSRHVKIGHVSFLKNGPVSSRFHGLNFFLKLKYDFIFLKELVLKVDQKVVRIVGKALSGCPAV